MSANINKNTSYKYKLREIIFSLPYEDHKMAMSALPKILGINKRTFERYIYAKATERYEMPAGHLAILARYFKCSMEDMFSQQPGLNTSLWDFGKKELAQQLNLKK